MLPRVLNQTEAGLQAPEAGALPAAVKLPALASWRRPQIPVLAAPGLLLLGLLAGACGTADEGPATQQSGSAANDKLPSECALCGSADAPAGPFCEQSCQQSVPTNARCEHDDECADDDACTIDSCGAQGVCEHLAQSDCNACTSAPATTLIHAWGVTSPPPSEWDAERCSYPDGSCGPQPGKYNAWVRDFWLEDLLPSIAIKRQDVSRAYVIYNRNNELDGAFNYPDHIAVTRMESAFIRAYKNCQAKVIVTTHSNGAVTAAHGWMAFVKSYDPHWDTIREESCDCGETPLMEVQLMMTQAAPGESDLIPLDSYDKSTLTRRFWEPQVGSDLSGSWRLYANYYQNDEFLTYDRFSTVGRVKILPYLEKIDDWETRQGPPFVTLNTCHPDTPGCSFSSTNNRGPAHTNCLAPLFMSQQVLSDGTPRHAREAGNRFTSDEMPAPPKASLSNAELYRRMQTRCQASKNADGLYCEDLGSKVAGLRCSDHPNSNRECGCAEGFIDSPHANGSRDEAGPLLPGRDDSSGEVPF